MPLYLAAFLLPILSGVIAFKKGAQSSTPVAPTPPITAPATSSVLSYAALLLAAGFFFRYLKPIIR